MLPRPAVFPALCLAAALVAWAPPAAADERVPRIPNEDLPVVGTCAPIRTTDVTHVMVGAADSVRWYRVAGVDEPMELDALERMLEARRGPGKVSSHAVWITASGAHPWVHVVRVRNACFHAGLYRVGLRVRSESTGAVMGFPLFLPADADSTSGGAKAGKAGKLDVRLNAVLAKDSKGASDPGHLYAAVRRALERKDTFGVDEIVGSIWVHNNAPLHYVLRCVDLLYRGGCAGVTLRGSARVLRLDIKVAPVLEIQGGMASRLPQQLKPPPLAPRGEAWGIDGPNKPGWVGMEVVDLPALGDGAAKPAPKAKVRPNYAAVRGGVPSQVLRAVDAEARTWSHEFGQRVLRGVRGDSRFPRSFVVGLRHEKPLRELILPVRKAFPDATRVEPSTLQFNAFLFDKGRILGRADVTLLTAGDRLRVVFGTWRPLDSGANIALAPFAVDPFAAGPPAAWRIWFEGVFQDVKQRGAAAWPLASADQVTPHFPALAHGGVSESIRKRGPALETLARELGRIPFDRVVLSVERGTAAVHAGKQVVGILDFSLRSEEHELRLDDLKPRRAR